MSKNQFSNSEIQDSVFSETLRSNLEEVLSNSFFTSLESEPVSLSGYKFFLKEKYSSVSYFIGLLENAEHLAEEVSHDLAEVFRSNRLDELGYFAGEIKNEYTHETWRMRTLSSFGVATSELNGLILDSSKKHQEIMLELSRSKDVFEVVGALMFLELFVVYEMKNLIHAFERDLPDLFPKDGYSYDRFPFNIQEYWYGHALHDTWHFRSIEEAVISCLGNDEKN